MNHFDKMYQKLAQQNKQKALAKNRKIAKKQKTYADLYRMAKS